MKALVTGARGMMGRDLIELAEAAGHDFWPTDVAQLVHDPQDRMDVTSLDNLRAAVERFEPEIILHLAALTNVDGCETDPADAYRVNALGTENVALVCRERGLRMLYISTGSVFDGRKPTPYTEFDDPNPQSVYSRSKWMGEVAVRQLVPEHFIVRAGWMFGGGPEDKKFVAKIIELARERDVIRAVDDKIGSPTYTRDISAFCLTVIENGRFGTYHGSNAGHCTRHEMAQAIVEFAGVQDCRVEPCGSAEFPLPAPRPRLEAMEALRGRLAGLDVPRPWREALRDYVESTLL